jgi:Mrp family chromosome partitioning ATPase
MLREAGVPILGAVENMSALQCPHCGERIEVFPPVAEERSVLREVPLLGEIPLDPAYARLNGVPPVFAAIATQVERALA